MRSLHLFAGGGGGLLADLLLGHRPVCAVEIDPNARAVLEARRADGWFPDLAEIHDDVRNFDGFKWRGRADIVAGGFPCQDISLAGNGAGLAGARSGLWWEMWRVIREVGPRYVYLENVAAITGRGMDQVLGALAQSGWDAEWLCLPASEVGAPHRRDRWWCLGRNPAHADSGRREQCHADHRCVPVTDAQRDAAHAHAGHEHAAQAVCAGRPAAVDGSDLPATDTGRSQRREQLPQVSEGKRMLPNSNDANNCGAPSQMQRNVLPLNAMVMLPTPTETANADSPAMQRWPAHRALMEGQQLPDGTLPALNPDWVELLMGWPVGWTDLLAATGPATGRPSLELPIGNLDESHD